MSDGESAFAWNAATGDTIPVSNPSGVFRAAFQESGLRLLGLRDGEARLWSSEDPASSTILDRGTTQTDVRGKFLSGVISPDGRFVATINKENTDKLRPDAEVVRIWDVRGMRRRPLPHDQPVFAAAFSRDGAWLATASGTKVRLWSVETGAAVSLDHFPGLENNAVMALAFSNNGRLVTGGWQDFHAIVWDARTGADLGRFNNGEAVRAVVFSPDPDGRWIATATFGGETRTSSVYIWDSATRTDVWRRDLKMGQSAQALAFSPDGQRLAAALSDGSAKIWDVGVERLWTLAREATRVCLSLESLRQIGILSNDQEMKKAFDRCEVNSGRVTARPSR